VRAVTNDHCFDSLIIQLDVIVKKQNKQNKQNKNKKIKIKKWGFYVAH